MTRFRRERQARGKVLGSMEPRSISKGFGPAGPRPIQRSNDLSSPPHRRCHDGTPRSILTSSDPHRFIQRGGVHRPQWGTRPLGLRPDALPAWRADGAEDVTININLKLNLSVLIRSVPCWPCGHSPDGGPTGESPWPDRQRTSWRRVRFIRRGKPMLDMTYGRTP
jgi:hypothetical protein